MGTSNYFLPLKPNSYHNINIDWGDGTSENYVGTPGYGLGGTSNNPIPTLLTHVYPASAVYNIKIKPNIPNGYPGFYQYGYEQQINYPHHSRNMLKVNNYGNSLSRWTNLDHAFSRCIRLSSIPSITAYDVFENVTSAALAWALCSSLSSFPFINTGKITNFYGTWAFCTSLTSFPLIDTSKARILGTSSTQNQFGTWQGCSSLSSFPLIDTSKVTFFSNAWSGCSSLTSFPPIDTSSAIETGVSRNFFGVWNGCSSLKTFPWINTSGVGAFGNGNQGTVGTWTNCSSLTSFPLIDTSKAAAFFQTWKDCRSLKTFPQINLIGLSGTGGSGAYVGILWATWANCFSLTTFPNLNTIHCTGFPSTWYSCTSLSSFPLIDTSNATDFTSTWAYCISLSTSDFPTLNMSKMTNGTSCFQGVKLTTTSYSSLLSSICATNVNNGVTFHGGNSQYNSTFGLSARNYLVNTKGWTITDGGSEP